MIKFFLLFYFISTFVFSQTDWEKWEAKEVSYQISGSALSEIPKQLNTGGKVINTAKNAYKFLFSDLDGDNCPFHPTCSAFYVDAVKETNFIKGTLMFADRFTRDINFFKGSDHYPYFSANKFYDPVENYLLNEKIVLFKYSGTISN